MGYFTYFYEQGQELDAFRVKNDSLLMLMRKILPIHWHPCTAGALRSMLALLDNYAKDSTKVYNADNCCSGC